MKLLKQSLIISSFFFLLAGLSGCAYAQHTGGGKTGLGIMLGEPSGISLKAWNNQRTAVDAGLAWSLSGQDAIHIHADYLWHSWLDVERGDLALYYGIGARAVFTSDPFIGVRIPIGLNYLAPESPLGFFVEVVPVLDVIPDTDGDANGAIGFRYYF